MYFPLSTAQLSTPLANYYLPCDLKLLSTDNVKSFLNNVGAFFLPAFSFSQKLKKKEKNVFNIATLSVNIDFELSLKFLGRSYPVPMKFLKSLIEKFYED